MNDLTASELRTLSEGIVPVGLTRFRSGLPTIQGLTKQTALYVVDLIENYRTTTRKRNVGLADEFFILAEKELPETAYDNDLCQIEKEIGMGKLLLIIFKDERRYSSN